MTKETIPFIMEIPLDLTYCNHPDVRVLCISTRNTDGRIFTEFEGLDTHTVCSIKDWMGVWKIAQERGARQWESRMNAMAIGDMSVNHKGYLSVYPIKEN